MSEAGHLREHEPDPVARLAPAPKLGQGRVIRGGLRRDEALEIEAHPGSVPGWAATDEQDLADWDAEPDWDFVSAADDSPAALNCCSGLSTG